MAYSRTKNSTRKLAYSALFLALALVLPFLTGQIKQIGSMLCPMHFPVLICGFVCGWPWGFAVGLLAPILRSLIFGMPPMYPGALAMMCELAVYGLVSGLMYMALPKKPWAIYVSLIIAMIAGRFVWGAVRYLMMLVKNTPFSFKAFIAGAVTTAIPGIVLQIVLVPIVVMVMKNAKLMPSV